MLTTTMNQSINQTHASADNQQLLMGSLKSKSKKFKAPDYLREMNILEKLENHKIIKNMNKRINFMKNPRYCIINRPVLISDSFKKPEKPQPDGPESKKLPFRITPNVVLFQDYMIDQVYEIPLTVTNIDNISRRIKYVPPSLPQFTIGQVKYPMKLPSAEDDDPAKEYGLIAPGMSVVFLIKFNATSFAEFEDNITICSDETFAHVPIQAKREAPCINLPELLDCQSCWIGDKVDALFRIHNKGGEAGFKFFCEKEEDDQKQQNEALQLKYFTVYPSEFFIQKNEVVDVYIQFTPSREGVQTEKVILACDNQTSAVYTLQGKGNMAELSVHKLDDIVVEEFAKESGIQSISFKGAFPHQTVTRTLQINNITSVRVKYHWNLFKTDKRNKQFNIEDPKNFCFKIEPEEGYFEPDKPISFKLSFLTKEPIPIYEYASLFIDDIPIQSIRNPPQQLSDNGTNNQPGYFGSNSARPSICYYEFELIGLTNYFNILVEPPFTAFSANLFVGKKYTKKFKLINRQKCNVQYQLKTHAKSNGALEAIFSGGDAGQIGAESEKEIEIGFVASQTGKNQKITVLIDFDFAHTQSFEMIANVVGPAVKVLDPVIDFGLMKTFSNKQITLKIQNTSSIPAEVVMKRINEKVEDIISNLSLNKQRKSTISESMSEDYFSKYFQGIDFNEEKKVAQLTFSPQVFTIQPEQIQEVRVTCEAQEAESFMDLIECVIKNSDSQYLNVTAEVQDIHVSLNMCKLNFDCLYATNTYVLSKDRTEQYVEIQNLGNLPCKFKWEIPISEEDNYAISFEPQQGTVQPKSNLPIKIKFVPKVGGPFYQLFVCDCEGMEYPLGFELVSNIYGLSIEYELYQEKHDNVASRKSIADQTSLPGQKYKSKFLTKTLEKNKLEAEKGKSHLAGSKKDKGAQAKLAQPLSQLEFYGCQINQPKYIDILIRNTSGINTKFILYSDNFQPHLNDGAGVTNFQDISSFIEQDKTVKFQQSISSNQKTNQQNLSCMEQQSYMKTSKKKCPMKQTKAANLLNADIEKKNNFTSKAGQELNKVRMLERDQRVYLSNNKGVALYCEPSSGVLPGHSEKIVRVSCFNDICGKFEDNLCVSIQGLNDVKKFPVQVVVKGSPVVISPNQLGVTYKGQYPLFNLGYYMRSSPAITREFKIENTGPKQIELEWKIYNLDEPASPDQNKKYFDIRITDPDVGSGQAAKLVFNPIEPPEATNGPFKLDSMTAILQERQEKFFKVSFTSETDRVFNSVLVAKPTIIDKDQKIKVDDLVLYLRSETIMPLVIYDKFFTATGVQRVKLQKWAIYPNKNEEKLICLTNSQKCNILFNMEISGQFKIMKTSTNSPAKYDLAQSLTLASKQKVNTNFNLVPNSNVEVTIKFEGYHYKDYEHWPMTNKNYTYGVLQLHYSNGDEQSFELEGVLLRPALTLNTSGHEDVRGSEIQDFGTVHINNKKTIAVFISNTSKVPAKWKLLHIKVPQNSQISEFTMTKVEKENNDKTDDNTVFEFSHSEGVLNGPSVPIKSLPSTYALPTQITAQDTIAENLYPQKILINFRPKKNVLYKSKFRIQVEEGPSLDFVLRGTGTYKEELEKY